MIRSATWANKYQSKPGKWIFEPDDTSRKIGKDIKRLLDRRWNPPKYFAHFHPGGHIQALKTHLHNNFFFKLDLLDFFEHIGKNRILRNTKRYVSDYREADQLARWSVTPSPKYNYALRLPRGFIQSPILASLCLSRSRIGRVLRDVAKSDMVVSVYMDDIIISSRTLTPISQVFSELSEAIVLSDFRINQGKTIEPCEEIEAFNIILRTGEIKLTDQRMNEFESAISGANDFKRNGVASYVRSVNEVQEQTLFHNS